jgi:hypothetical protein
MENKSVGGRLMFIGRIGFKWPRIDVNNEVLNRVQGKVHEFSKDVQTTYKFSAPGGWHSASSTLTAQNPGNL